MYFVNCFMDFIIGNVQFTQSSDILSEVQWCYFNILFINTDIILITSIRDYQETYQHMYLKRTHM